MATKRPSSPVGIDPPTGDDLDDGTTNLGLSPIPGSLGGERHRQSPVERPPELAFLSFAQTLSYRPEEDKVESWHTVVKGKKETFWTISEMHQVPVERIIEFDFHGSVVKGRVDPAIVNWYLHRHKGFGCPVTHNHLNRMFKGGERVAIPFLGSVEIGEATLVKPVSLDDSKGTDLLA